MEQEQPVNLGNNAQQVYIPTELWPLFVNGSQALAYKSIEGLAEYRFKKINVAGDEVIKDHGKLVTIEKHY